MPETSFRDLHMSAFVMPNPHDPGTAKLLASMGFKALATSSAGFAFTRGLPDGGVGFEAMMAHCRDMVAATPLPVSADLERGKGDSAERAAETIFAAEAAGLAGCSIEDHTGDPEKPIYDFTHAVERVVAAAEAARAVKRDFVFTARAENFLWDRDDIDDTIRRLQAFEKAGADVLYAPGITDVAVARTICASVSKPVNVMAQAGFSVAALADAGVKRISLGPKLTNLAFAAMKRAAGEILEKGSFEFSREIMPFSELQTLFSAKS